jgi:hypothetical protein
LDVYVTPKRIIYERYLLEELTADTSPTSAQLQDGLASIGVAVDAYNNGATPNESEWVAQKRQNPIRRNPRGNPGGPNFERPYLGRIAVTRAEK